jgi:hypothetical protein
MTEMSYNDIWKLLETKLIFKDKIHSYSTKRQFKKYIDMDYMWYDPCNNCIYKQLLELYVKTLKKTDITADKRIVSRLKNNIKEKDRVIMCYELKIKQLTKLLEKHNIRENYDSDSD